MQELLDQILDYLKGIWIKRRYIMIATWLICPISWYFVAQMPNVYESSAKVYVDTQSLLRPLLRGLTVETNPNTQVNLMVRTLLSRPNLEKIARMTDLDIQANTPIEFDKILDDLKDSIKITKSGRGREDNIYSVSVENADPVLAKNIVQSTITVFIENTLGETRNDSDEAQKFLDAQIRDYENRLLAAEARRTEFKQKYSGVLPNQTGGYYGLLKAEKAKLKEAELRLREYQTRLKATTEQLAGERPSFGLYSSESINSPINTQYDSRIAQLEANLDSLLVRYTDNHPDVKEVSRRLNALKKQRQDEVNQYLASTNNDGDSIVSVDKNPVFQQMKLQKNNLESEVASLVIRVNEFKANVKSLEERIHAIPEIESEMLALDRGYEITKQKHQELLKRKDTAMLAQKAESSTEKISFRTIDPPRVPQEASGPQRILFFIGVTILAFGVGIGLSLLTSLISPIVTSPNQLSRSTGLPILGVVSATENLNLAKWQTRKTLVFVFSNALLLLLLTAFIVYFTFPSAIQAPLQRIF